MGDGFRRAVGAVWGVRVTMGGTSMIAFQGRIEF
jgi:hypothetical protein